MPWLKYYEVENEKYRLLRDSKISEEEAEKALKKLCRHFGLDPIPLEFVNGKRKYAHYHPTFKRIRLVRDWMNWKTLAHEFAHYWDDMKRKAEIEALAPEIYKRTPGTEDYEYYRRRIHKIRKANWHGKRHAKLIARAIKYIESKGWNTGLLKPGAADPEVPVVQEVVVPVVMPVPAQVDDLRAAVYAALPEIMKCPRCQGLKTKAEFGVRVVKKDAEGKPVKVIRQSYCKECR